MYGMRLCVVRCVTIVALCMSVAWSFAGQRLAQYPVRYMHRPLQGQLSRLQALRSETVVPRGGPIADSFYSAKTFKELGLLDTMNRITSRLRLKGPSKIQALSFKPILEGKTCIVADQTGTGKTLAYLLPIVQRIHEATRKKLSPPASGCNPYLLILAPTSDLALQIGRVLRTINQAQPNIRSCALVGGGMSQELYARELEKLQRGVEILVATPGKAEELLGRQLLKLSDAQAVVLDETDALFMDDTFKLSGIGTAASPTTQFVFVTATLPQQVEESIQREFPEVIKLSGPGLHRISPHIDVKVVDCSDDDAAQLIRNKKRALLDAAASNSDQRVIVFCSSISACRVAENTLRRADRKGQKYDVLAYHAAVDGFTMHRNLAQFIQPLLKKPQVLVCSDRASRGLDFDRIAVDHVILYDFPRDASEYLRRVGRTGRAGKRGRVTAIVYGRYLPVAHRIVAASKAGLSLEPTVRQSN